MFRGHKLITLLISLIGAVVLWLYVVTTIKPQTDFPVSSIPISISDSMLTERGLIITAQSPEILRLDLRTSRANVAKLNAETIRVVADASSVREPGEKNLPFVVTFPDTVRSGDVDILRKSVDTVTITVDRLQRATFPIELNWTGSMKEGFTPEVSESIIDPAEVVVDGPEKEVSRIAKVVVDYDVTDKVETETVSAPIRFLDEDGEELEFSELTSFSVTQTNLTLPILRIKEITLTLGFIEGDGVRNENAAFDITPKTIHVKGAASLIDSLSDTLELGQVKLADIPENYYENEYNVNNLLNPGVTNMGEETVKAVVRLSGVSTFMIDVSDIRLINKPDPINFDTIVTTPTVKLRLRGSTEQIQEIKKNKNNGLYVEVDLAAYSNQTGAFPVQGRVVKDSFDETYPSVSVSENVEVGVKIIQLVEIEEE